MIDSGSLVDKCTLAVAGWLITSLAAFHSYMMIERHSLVFLMNFNLKCLGVDSVTCLWCSLSDYYL